MIRTLVFCLTVFCATAQNRASNFVPFDAIVESIEFKGVTTQIQKSVLDRIQVRVGDQLSAETRQRIGRELGKVQKGLTFTYKPGAVRGTAKLIIDADC